MLAPISKENVKIRKNFDEIERIKKHLKTKNITVDNLTVNTTITTPGINVKISSFTCPGVTGDYSVTGVGFQPRYVDFLHLLVMPQQYDAVWA